jgi:hypothetical protein
VDFQLASKYPKPQFSFSGQSLVGSFHSWYSWLIQFALSIFVQEIRCQFVVSTHDSLSLNCVGGIRVLPSQSLGQFPSFDQPFDRTAVRGAIPPWCCRMLPDASFILSRFRRSSCLRKPFGAINSR